MAHDDLHAFGIGLDDDAAHPWDPDDASWNESWFWDWYDEHGELAGHCRLGALPAQGRAWVWCYQRWGDAWLAIDQPFLSEDLLARPAPALERPGLGCSYRIDEPLRRGHLAVHGPARVLGGAHDGRVVPLRVELDVEALGVPHSTGQGDADGHRSEGYDARRFEQPIAVSGTVTVDGHEAELIGRGERDHSWGPRLWDIEWSFLVLGGERRRLQCVEVRFPGDGTIEVGYLQDEDGTRDLEAVRLVVERADDLAAGTGGRVELDVDGACVLAATIEPVATHEMDLSHVLAPGSTSTYRRSFVRAQPDDGGPPLQGWLEDHVLHRLGDPGDR